MPRSSLPAGPDRRRRALTVREIAQQLRVSPSRVRAWIARGELAAIDVAAIDARRRSLRVLPGDLDQFLRKRRAMVRGQGDSGGKTGGKRRGRRKPPGGDVVEFF